MGSWLVEMGKMCPKCRTPDAEFGPNAGRRDGLAVYCRTCTKAYMAEKQYDKARWLAHREEESERNKAYRQANADRIKQTDRAKAARRRAANPGAIRAHNIARKHGEKRATPAWVSLDALNAVYAEAKRLEALDGIRRHVDHQIPLKHPLVCGLHTPDNLQVLPAVENMAKHNSFRVE